MSTKEINEWWNQCQAYEQRSSIPSDNAIDLFHLKYPDASIPPITVTVELKVSTIKEIGRIRGYL